MNPAQDWTSLPGDAYLQALDALAAGGMQYVFVSHYEEDAPSSADRVAQMKDGHLTVLR